MYCLTCNHEGDQKNPLAIQGSLTIPYCHNCLMLAEKAAAESIKNSEWFIKWNKEEENNNEISTFSTHRTIS